jgi:CRISPR-associated endonuclease/helicase Cas3
MHVVFVSQCEKKALKRSMRVLDAYAMRHGDRTWMSPMTDEALQVIRFQLRAVATRQMAVACYVNEGRSQMRLLWVVGRRDAFGENGEVAVASKTRSSPANSIDFLPAGVRMASLLACAAGKGHDFGKFFLLFKKKLAGDGPMSDAVRHEWISLHVLLSGLLDEIKPGEYLDWPTLWDQSTEVSSENPLKKFGDLEQHFHAKKGIHDAFSALLYLVFTHHRLPLDKGRLSNRLGDETYIQPGGEKDQDLQPAAMPSEETLNALRKSMHRLHALCAQEEADLSPLTWRAICTLARPALILADHGVSSIRMAEVQGHGASIKGVPGVVFANTVTDDHGQRIMNQELNWHLQQVGEEAGKMPHRMLNLKAPGISSEVRQRMRAQALATPTESRFHWQARGAQALREAQEQESMPTLVFNVAGTGCGKTRANVLFADALRNDEILRLATGLNLRTLTLQTRDAYALQMKMNADDLACVIGSAMAKRLHEHTQEEDRKAAQKKSVQFEDEDGNEFEDGFEAVGGSDPAPDWLEKFLEKNPNLRAVIMAPALVCTIDFLVKAGDPNQKGNHALTFLRIMHSDLILDEIDSYDPKAMVAVMRLVAMAAMFGRNVIASSATLTGPLAKALWDAFDLGIKMGHSAGLLSSKKHRQVLIEEACAPSIASHAQAQDLLDWYRSALTSRCASMGTMHRRKVELIDLPLPRSMPVSSLMKAYHDAVAKCATVMHDRHGWELVVDGQVHRISLGLVRMANITPAVEMARALTQTLPSARVACYHAQLAQLHRYKLERAMDKFLKRDPTDQDPAERILECQEINEAIRSSIRAGRTETMFIVVATPVEEIGRDHDFDWGIFEPSSAQALVQGPGRVNRHRLVDVIAPNVAFLRFNVKAMKSAKATDRCFLMPGLEMELVPPYASHDLKDLLDWGALQAAGQVDVRLRYDTDKHRLALFDDQSTEAQINLLAKRFLNSDSSLWMGADTYKEASLREPSTKEAWTRDLDGNFYREEQVGEKAWQKRWRRTNMQVMDEQQIGSWLNWTNEDLCALADALGIDHLQALSVEVTKPSNVQEVLYSEAFGYFRSLK